MGRDVLLLAGTIGGVAVLAVLAVREMRRLRLQRFAGRESWSGSEFYEAFYAGSGIKQEVVVEARDYVAKVLNVPPSLLRATDRFDSELAPPKGWETPLISDLAYLKRYGIIVDKLRVRPVWRTIQTLDDLIRDVAAGVSAGPD